VPIRGLRERQDPRLGKVEVGALEDEALDASGVSLPFGPVPVEQLLVPLEKNSGAPHSSVSMCANCGRSRYGSSAERGEGERVGGGAVEDEEDLGVRLSNAARSRSHARCVRVGAGSSLAPGGGLAERGPRPGQRPEVFVAERSGVRAFGHVTAVCSGEKFRSSASTPAVADSGRWPTCA